MTEFAGGSRRRSRHAFRMSQFLQTPGAQAVLWSAVLSVLVAIGIYAIGKARNMRRERPPTANELMTNFRELHSKGELSDEEFRTIKGLLAARLQSELMRNGEEG